VTIFNSTFIQLNKYINIKNRTKANMVTNLHVSILTKKIFCSQPGQHRIVRKLCDHLLIFYYNTRPLDELRTTRTSGISTSLFSRIVKIVHHFTIHFVFWLLFHSLHQRILLDHYHHHHHHLQMNNWYYNTTVMFVSNMKLIDYCKIFRPL
jgi:hypothetical protein